MYKIPIVLLILTRGCNLRCLLSFLFIPLHAFWTFDSRLYIYVDVFYLEQDGIQGEHKMRTSCLLQVSKVSMDACCSYCNCGCLYHYIEGLHALLLPSNRFAIGLIFLLCRGDALSCPRLRCPFLPINIHRVFVQLRPRYRKKNRGYSYDSTLPGWTYGLQTNLVSSIV